MDVAMPIMDGIEATKAIIEYEQSKIKHTVAQIIVGLTAHATEQYKNSCLEAGMDEFSKQYYD